MVDIRNVFIGLITDFAPVLADSFCFERLVLAQVQVIVKGVILVVFGLATAGKCG